MMTGNNNLERWHQCVFDKDMQLLGELLDDNVEFHSPTVWKPKQGKMVTQYILQTILGYFEGFEYHREWVEGGDMALEFSAAVDGKNLKGIDLITWNEEGKIIRFEVLIRPLNTLEHILEKMTAQLKEAGLI